MRVLLTIGVIAFFLLCVLAMWWGYRNRARRQSAVLLPFPKPPADLGPDLLPPITGVYISTANAASWQDRIAIGDIGFRAAATLWISGHGLLYERQGADAVFIPSDFVLDARTDRKIAGKVMGPDGLLVVRWRHGEFELDTGFRGDDKDVYSDWVETVQGLAKGGTAR